MRQSAKKVISNNISYIIRELEFFSGIEISEKDVIFLILSVYLESGVISNYDIIDFAINVRKEPMLSATARSLLMATVCGRNDLGKLLLGIESQGTVAEELIETKPFQAAETVAESLKSTIDKEELNTKTEEQESERESSKKVSSLNEILAEELNEFNIYREQEKINELMSHRIKNEIISDVEERKQFPLYDNNVEYYQGLHTKPIFDENEISSKNIQLSAVKSESVSKFEEKERRFIKIFEYEDNEQQYASFLNVLLKDNYNFTEFEEIESIVENKDYKKRRNNLIKYLKSLKVIIKYKLGWLLTIEELEKQTTDRTRDIILYNLYMLERYLKKVGYTESARKLELVSLESMEDLIESLTEPIIEDKHSLINLLKFVECTSSVCLDYKISDEIKLDILKDDPDVWRMLLSTMPKSLPLIEKIIGESYIAAIYNINNGFVTVTTEPSEDFFYNLLHGPKQVESSLYDEEGESSSSSLMNILRLEPKTLETPISRSDIYDVLVVSKEKITGFCVLNLRNVGYINKERRIELKFQSQQIKGLALYNVSVDELKHETELVELYSMGNAYYPMQVSNLHKLRRFESSHDTFSDSKRSLIHVLFKYSYLEYVRVHNGTNICDGLVLHRNIHKLCFFYVESRSANDLVLKLTKDTEKKGEILVLEETYYDNDQQKYVSPNVVIEGPSEEAFEVKARLCRVSDITGDV